MCVAQAVQPEATMLASAHWRRAGPSERAACEAIADAA